VGTAGPGAQTQHGELVAQLHSDNEQIRSGAFESVRNDPAAMGDPKVRAALVDLLDRENHEPLLSLARMKAMQNTLAGLLKPLQRSWTGATRARYAFLPTA
jgi:hypothetical protein